jgi:hypothetical protein
MGYCEKEKKSVRKMKKDLVQYPYKKICEYINLNNHSFHTKLNFKYKKKRTRQFDYYNKSKRLAISP